MCLPSIDDSLTTGQHCTIYIYIYIWLYFMLLCWFVVQGIEPGLLRAVQVLFHSGSTLSWSIGCSFSAYPFLLLVLDSCPAWFTMSSTYVHNHTQWCSIVCFKFYMEWRLERWLSFGKCLSASQAQGPEFESLAPVKDDPSWGWGQGERRQRLVVGLCCGLP